MNQFASDAGCKDISNNLIETALGFLKEAEVKNTDPFSEPFEERSRILGAVSGMFLYKILHKTYNKERDTLQVFDFYEILLSKEDYKNAIYYMRRFLMEMINFEYDFGYISYFFSIFEKIIIKNKRHMLDINIIIPPITIPIKLIICAVLNQKNIKLSVLNPSIKNLPME